jgi:hypothetical protein
MVFIARQEPFICVHCQDSITPLKHGSYRNHCPKCLHSLHVDLNGPGDRLATCLGAMKPIGLDQTNKKGYVLIHKCTICKKISRNKAAPDDELEKITPNIFE